MVLLSFFLQELCQLLDPSHQLTYPTRIHQRNNDLLHCAIDSQLLPTLGKFFQTFDAPMHIPTELQNLLLAHIHQTFRQEMELFLVEMFMQFAPWQYWDRQGMHPLANAQHSGLTT